MAAAARATTSRKYRNAHTSIRHPRTLARCTYVYAAVHPSDPLSRMRYEMLPNPKIGQKTTQDSRRKQCLHLFA